MNIFQKIIEAMQNNLIEKEFDNGIKRLIVKNDAPSWVAEIIHDAHDTSMPRDDVYDVIGRVVDHLYNNDVEDIDEARESITEIEPDVYTHDLLKWLSSNLGNVDYLGQAAEIGITDGFQLLAYAQTLFIQEIGDSLLNSIENYMDEIEETFEDKDN